MKDSGWTVARIAAFVGIPLLWLVERASYYAMRGVVRLYLSDAPGVGLGLPRAEAASVYGTWTLSMAGFVLLGGLVAFAMGPRIPLVAGFGLSAAGVALLGNGGAGALWPALLLVAAGQGLLRPSSYAVLAQEIGRGFDNLRVAACFALYVAIDIGAFVGGMTTGLRSTGPAKYQTVFSLSTLGFVGGLALSATLVLILAKHSPRTSPGGAAAPQAGVGGGRREGAQADLPLPQTGDMSRLNEALLRGGPGGEALARLADRDGPPAEPRNGALAAALVLLAVLPCLFAGTAFDTVMFDATDKLPGSAATTLFNLGTGIDISAALLGTILMLVIALTSRRTAPVLYGAAGGLLLMFVGCALLLAAGDPASLIVVTAAVVFVRLGDVTLVSIALGRFLGGPRARMAPLWAAGWHLAMMLVLPVSSASALTGAAGRTFLGAMVPVCLIAGVLVAVLAPRLERLFAPAER